MAPGLGSLLLTTDMSYYLARGRDTVSMKIFDSQTDRFFHLWKKRGTVGAETHPTAFRTTVEHYEGTLRGSLLSSLTAKVPSQWVASRFMDAYILEQKLDRLPSGTRFALTVEKKFDGNQFIRYGEVLQTSLEIDGVMVKKNFVRFQQGGVFVSTKDLFSDRPFFAPVSYLRIASLFQPRRLHPITGRVKPHMGIDFELAEGEPVFAARKGTVVRLGHNHAAGNFIVLRHQNGIETAYDHLKKVTPGLREGKSVDAGQTIGEVGCTGYCTKAHLHFAIRMNGRMVNPAQYIKAFPSQYQESLQARVAQQ